MIKEFDLHKVHKAGARFSKEKAEWFNHQYLQKKNNSELISLLKNIDEVQKSQISENRLEKIISLMKERATFVKDIYNEGKFFFIAPSIFDEKGVKKAWKNDTSEIITNLYEVLKEQENFSVESIKETIHHFTESKELGMGRVMMPLRLALVGELKGPDVPEIMELIGKEETLKRIQFILNTL